MDATRSDDSKPRPRSRHKEGTVLEMRDHINGRLAVSLLRASDISQTYSYSNAEALLNCSPWPWPWFNLCPCGHIGTYSNATLICWGLLPLPLPRQVAFFVDPPWLCLSSLSLAGQVLSGNLEPLSIVLAVGPLLAVVYTVGPLLAIKARDSTVC